MGEQGFSRRKFLTLSGVTVGALASPGLLAACTTSGTPTGGGGTDGVLRIGWTSEPDVMNPFTLTSSAAAEILALVYDKLMEYDADINPIGALAESSEYSDDGKSITYKLRDGVTWQDGKPFSAEDVVFSWEVIADNNLGEAAQYLHQLTSIDIEDPQTVVAKFSQPQAFDPALIIPIVPKHLWEGMSGKDIQKFANPKPIGTGPFIFKKWTPGQSVDLTRNDDWWGDAPAAKTVTFVHFDSSDVMTQSLVGGELDVLSEVPPLLWDGLSTADNVTPVELESFSFHHIGMNVSTNPKSQGNPLLLDKTIRQALSLAVDRQQLVNLALAGHGLPGSVLLPAAFGDYQLEIPPDQQLNNDPDKANQMLDDGGYKMGPNGVRVSSKGEPLSFRLIAIQATDVDVRAAQLFVTAASKVGIELKLQTLDENTLDSLVYDAEAPNFDLYIWGWDSGTADPSYMLGIPLTNQIGNNNDTYYSNPTYDKLYVKQATTVDKEDRIPIVQEMQQIYYDDCAYIIMWYQSKLQAYRSNTWQGWKESPGGMVFNFTRTNYLTVTPAG
jgi:peptide/nickel transport system substrate-binding protein